MRINEEGIMCVQHQVVSENGHETYIGDRNERTRIKSHTCRHVHPVERLKAPNKFGTVRTYGNACILSCPIS